MEEHKAIVRRHYAQVNQHNLDLAIADFATDAKVHGFAPYPLDFDEYRQILGMFLAAFPNARLAGGL